MPSEVINPYAIPYIIKENSLSSDQLDHTENLITSAKEAAIYTGQYSPDNGLENHIGAALKGSAEFKSWCQLMPSVRPAAIKIYQKEYANRDDDTVNADILSYGIELPIGQELTHGGLWTGGNSSILLSRPLSTSLSPIVAFQNALHREKAYRNGRLDLIVLTMRAATKAFVFTPRGNLSHEKEILLPKDLRLTFKNETCVRSDFIATDRNNSEKRIPVYVVTVEAS